MLEGHDPAGHVEGLAKARFCLRLRARCRVRDAGLFGRVLTGLGLAWDWPGTCLGLQRQRPFESIQLRLPPTFPAVVYQGQGLSQGAQSLFDLPHFPVCLGEQRKIITNCVSILQTIQYS